MPRPPASAASKFVHMQIAFALTAAPVTFGNGVVLALASRHLISDWWLALTFGWAVVPLTVYLRMQRYLRQLRPAGAPTR